MRSNLEIPKLILVRVSAAKNRFYLCIFCGTDTSYPRCSQQAYNKWFIAYTLINNIELSEYRACHVALKMDLAKKWKRPKWIKEAARYNSMDENENSGNERLSGGSARICSQFTAAFYSADISDYSGRTGAGTSEG